MIEIGTVKKIDGNEYVVTVNRKPECSKCGLCGMKDNVTKMDFRAIKSSNEQMVEVGDTVRIENGTDIRLMSYFLVFLVPLLLVAVGILLGYLIKIEWLGVIFSIALVSLYYAILSVFDKKIKNGKKSVYKITEVLTPSNEGEKYE
jgi:positive regulator of sigma E activity